jgi:thymidylate synthase
MLAEVYSSVDHMVADAWREILKNGSRVQSRNGESYELLGYKGVLIDTDHTFAINPRRKLSPHYACAEVLWYLSRTRDIAMIKAYAPQYEKFAEDNIAYGAYGDRWVRNMIDRDMWKIARSEYCGDQLTAAIDLLKKKPDTRQAVVTMWEANDLMHAIAGDHKDLPCTLSMHFVLRNKTLNLITTMRSNDAWLGLPYDVFAFTCILRLVAQAIGARPGQYIHQAASLHLYTRNCPAANEAQNEYFKSDHVFSSHAEFCSHAWSRLSMPDWAAQTVSAVNYETIYRLDSRTDASDIDGWLEDDSDCISNNEMLRDLVACCANKWCRSNAPKIHSKLLQEGLNNVNC